MGKSIQKTLFCNPGAFEGLLGVDKTAILEVIRKKSPISIRSLNKEFKIDANSLYHILRDFSYAGLIKTRIRTNKNKKSERFIYYNLKKSRYAYDGI